MVTELPLCHRSHRAFQGGTLWASGVSQDPRKRSQLAWTPSESKNGKHPKINGAVCSDTIAQKWIKMLRNANTSQEKRGRGNESQMDGETLQFDELHFSYFVRNPTKPLGCHMYSSRRRKMEVEISPPQAAKQQKMKDNEPNIRQNTTVLCWGAHDLGQLGLGTNCRSFLLRLWCRNWIGSFWQTKMLKSFPGAQVLQMKNTSLLPETWPSSRTGASVISAAGSTTRCLWCRTGRSTQQEATTGVSSVSTRKPRLLVTLCDHFILNKLNSFLWSFCCPGHHLSIKCGLRCQNGASCAPSNTDSDLPYEHALTQKSV